MPRDSVASTVTQPLNHTKRPTEVVVATALLWGSLAIAIPYALRRFSRYTDMESLGYAVCDGAVIFALQAWLIQKTWRGRNWARITMLILCVIGAAFLSPVFLLVFRRPTFAGFVLVGQALMQAFALYLVFAEPGRRWFTVSSQAVEEVP